MKPIWEMNLEEMLARQKQMLRELQDLVGPSVYARIEALCELTEAIGECE